MALPVSFIVDFCIHRLELNGGRRKQWNEVLEMKWWSVRMKCS